MFYDTNVCKFVWYVITMTSYGHNGVSNQQRHGCLRNRSYRRRSKKISKLRVTGLCAGNSPVTGEFPAQSARNAEKVSIWWRHHEYDWSNGLCRSSCTKSAGTRSSVSCNDMTLVWSTRNSHQGGVPCWFCANDLICYNHILCGP